MPTEFEEKTPCPSCGYGFDMSSAVDGSNDPPVEGDVTVCISCADVAVFTATADRGLTLRAPTPEEKEEALTMPEVVHAKLALLALRSRP